MRRKGSKRVWTYVFNFELFEEGFYYFCSKDELKANRVAVVPEGEGVRVGVGYGGGGRFFFACG